MNPLTDGLPGPMDAASPQGQPQAAAVDPVTAMTQAHEQTQAQFKKLMESKTRLDKVKAAMDELVKMGDQVSIDDLIKSAGDLTAHGFEPTALAGLLAQAPPGGEALAGWLQQQDQQITAQSAKMMPMLAAARQQLGVDALHVLMAHHMTEGQKKPVGPAMPPAGPLPTPGADSGASQPNPLM